MVRRGQVRRGVAACAIGLPALLIGMGMGTARAQTPPELVKCSDNEPKRSPAATVKSVNGAPALSSEWPWFAALRVHDEKKDVSLAICGGVMIAPQWVLTAGHCLHFVDKSTLRTSYYGAMDPANYPVNARMEVIAGVDDLREAGPYNTFAVEQIVMQDDYAAAYAEYAKQMQAYERGERQDEPIGPPELIGHDLALVKIAGTWTGPLAPVARHAKGEIPTDGYVRVAGFGTVEVTREPDGQYYPKLRKYVLGTHTLYAGCARLMQVTMPLVGAADCYKRWAQPNFKPAIGEDQICAGYDEANQDSCMGDSGGPLVATDARGRRIDIGIVSWGDSNCAGTAKSYGVYTRIAKFADWIDHNVGPITSSTPGETSDEVAFNDGGFIRTALGDLDIHLGAVKGKVQLAIEGGPRVTLGRNYRLLVNSTVAGRLVLIDVDAAGKVMQIFPNKFVRDETVSRIAANARIAVPSPSWGFDAFRASPPLGKGTLVAIVVPDDFPTLTYGAEAEAQGSKGFEPVRRPTNYIMNLLQQVEVHSGRARARGQRLEKRWAYDRIEYEITP